jgi:hypothetical protein
MRCSLSTWCLAHVSETCIPEKFKLFKKKKMSNMGDDEERKLPTVVEFMEKDIPIRSKRKLENEEEEEEEEKADDDENDDDDDDDDVLGVRPGPVPM